MMRRDSELRRLLSLHPLTPPATNVWQSTSNPWSLTLIPVCQKPYVSKKLGTTTKPCEMGVDCDFDIYPPLERTKANQEQYELFLREVLDTYGPRDGDGVE